LSEQLYQPDCSGQADVALRMAKNEPSVVAGKIANGSLTFTSYCRQVADATFAEMECLTPLNVVVPQQTVL
jgi:hypothetical protein